MGRLFKRMNLPVAAAAAVRPAVPAASAAASHVDGAAYMIRGLGNRLTTGRSRRSARDSDQAHACCHDDGEHQMTHVDISLLQRSKPAIGFAPRKADGRRYPLRSVFCEAKPSMDEIVSSGRHKTRPTD